MDQTAGAGVTHAANLAAFARCRLRPRVLRNVARVDCSTTLLGHELAVPVLAAPTGGLGLAYPQGEAVMSRGSVQAGTLPVRSMMGLASWSETAALADGPWWAQVYLPSERGMARSMLQYARACGAAAICLTVDLPVIPLRGATHARLSALPTGATVGNLRHLEQEFGVETQRLWDACFSGTLTWDSLAWIVSEAGLPVVVKGVLDPDDARLAVQHGAAGLIVSNHGGRSLDGVPATLDALPAVVQVVGDQVPLLVDGGVRSGSDVLRALALGAAATLVGRPVVWALACGGEAGVAAYFERLAGELRYAMALTGVTSVSAIGGDVLW